MIAVQPFKNIVLINILGESCQEICATISKRYPTMWYFLYYAVGLYVDLPQWLYHCSTWFFYNGQYGLREGYDIIGDLNRM